MNSHIKHFTAAFALSLFFIGATFIKSGDDKPKRFDYLVREDLFAGFAGDTVAFDRAMKLCEDTLMVNPNHAEAMVWHGCGLWYKSGTAFRSGDIQRGREYADRGIGEMDNALSLAPTNLGVVIPHGAALLASAKYIPGEYGKMILHKGLTDYENVLKMQTTNFSEVSEHGRGELLGGLADAYLATGDSVKGKAMLKRIVKDLPNTPYATSAKEHLAKPTSARPLTCIGCHE